MERAVAWCRRSRLDVSSDLPDRIRVLAVDPETESPATPVIFDEHALPTLHPSADIAPAPAGASANPAYPP